MKAILIGLVLTLATASSATAMSTFTDQWMSGTKLYATASTDSEDVDEVASADIQISGPSGSTSVASLCEWYYASVTKSLALTTAGTHHASSNHWTQSVANIFLSEDIPVATRTAYWGPPVMVQGDKCFYSGLACNPGTTATCTGGYGVTGITFVPNCPQYVKAQWLVVFGSCWHPAYTTAATGPGNCT
jgi:hypothetical protein